MPGHKIRWRVPDGLDEKRFNELLSVVLSEFGAGWLETVSEHPLRKTWRSYDRMAGLEILILALALERARLSSEPSALSGLTAKLRPMPDGNFRGAMWELLCLSLLTGPGRVARLAGGSQPGFDLHLSCASGLGLRISCKSPNQSAEGASFLADSNALASSISDHLRLGPPVCAVIARTEARFGLDATTVTSFGKKLSKRLLSAPYEGLKQRRLSGFDVMVGPLAPIPGFIYSHGGTSHVLHFLYPMTSKEQGRLWASLEAADASFGRCPPSGPGVIDAAAIRVTATVSLRDAEQQVREYFKAFRDCRLSAVLVCRASMIHDGGDSDSRGIAYESVVVLNPRVPKAVRARLRAALQPRPVFGTSVAPDLLSELVLGSGLGERAWGHSGTCGKVFINRNTPPHEPFQRPAIPGLLIQTHEQIAGNMGMISIPMKPDRDAFELI